MWNASQISVSYNGLTSDQIKKMREACEDFAIKRISENTGVVDLSDSLDFVRALRDKNLPVFVAKNLKEEFFSQSNIDSTHIQKIKDSNLFLYQKQDAVWLASKNKALLANEMGTGKTPLTLMALPHKDACKSLIVCPASLKSVWADECATWRKDLNVSILSGKKSFRMPSEGEVLVANYEILPSLKSVKDIQDDITFRYQLIADEAHYLKSGKSQRTKSFRALSKAMINEGGSVWLLSGTPMLNDPLEMWNILMGADLHKDAFGSWPQFVDLFNGTKNEWNAWKWGTPKPEAKRRIKRVSCRRTRKEVLPELPSKFYRKSKVVIDQKTKGLCDKFVSSLEGIDLDDTIESIISSKKEKIGFSEISEVRRELASAKIPHMLSLIETYENGDEPIVVFSAHVSPIEVLEKREGWRIITGKVSNEYKAESVKLFQEGGLKGIGATIKAGGVGLTLTNAHQAIFVDLDWTPAMNLQAEDRLCRIGQTKGVIINRITADHILDQRIMSILTTKKKLLEAVSLT